ncbi:HDOD domain-containing protein [Paenibacillus apii]|uniref:HDOD domain-containing protein n=1 Tax=Paenibacillus apii TaxID=1850370 RepID=UPI00143BA490|nr:HDOD domain-containing protein [Paenibacillus apii]NJJ41840.1 HDOD domain-containing protein [Paenibacillus apii]
MNQIDVYQALETSPKMPVIPPEISDIFEMIRQPDLLDVDLLAEKVALYDGLNQAILANVNSGYYQISRTIENINEAIVFLGMKTMRNLLIYFITELLFHDELGKSTLFSSHQYWRHNLGTAVACNMLSSKLKIGDRFQLFSYGLCHDIGFAILNACLPDPVDQIFETMNRGVHHIVAEKIALGGKTHADIGAWICEKWGLPEDLGLVVKYHHSPLLSTDNLSEIELIHVADCISTEYYQRLIGLDVRHPINARVMQNLGITKDMVEEIGASLPDEVEKVSRIFA